MKTTILTAALSLAMAFSLVSKADNQAQPTANQPMPVMFGVDGHQFPVVAKIGQNFFPVFIVAGGRPYYEVTKGESHYLDASDAYYMQQDGKSNSITPVALPKGKSQEEVQTVLLNGKKGADTKLVHWGRGWGYYGCGHSYYHSYSYYPSYCYYGGGYYGGYCGNYYGGYAGYYGYGYGYNYYNYYNPCYYTGYSYCINSCW